MRRTLFLIGALLVLVTPSAFAGAYVGAGVGNATVELKDADFSFDEDDTGWKIFVGYSFFEFLAVEAGYVDFGSPEAAVRSTLVKADVTAIDAFAVGKLSVGPLVELFAKLGFVSWDADVSASGAGGRGSGSADGTDAAYGIGLTIDLEKLGLRLEAEQFDTGTIDGTDTDVFMISAGIEYRF